MSRAITAQLPLQFPIHDDHRIENFQAGVNAELVAEITNRLESNSELRLYLWGPEGYGKTHLLQAACRMCGRLGRTAAYLPLSECDALPPSLLDGMENVQLICLDDAHRIAGRGAWEMALFRLLNRSRESAASILIAARQSPANTGIGLADLRTRLSWGLVYTVHPLSDADKLSALQQRAEHRGFNLPDETGKYLLKRVARDMGSLFALLYRLDEASLAAGRRLTIPFVKSILEND